MAQNSRYDVASGNILQVIFSAKDINNMKDDLQEKWIKQSNLEELEGSMLENSLGCEIIVVGLKADILQVSDRQENFDFKI